MNFFKTLSKYCRLASKKCIHFVFKALAPIQLVPIKKKDVAYLKTYCAIFLLLYIITLSLLPVYVRRTSLLFFSTFLIIHSAQVRHCCFSVVVVETSWEVTRKWRENDDNKSRSREQRGNKIKTVFSSTNQCSDKYGRIVNKATKKVFFIWPYLNIIKM